MNEHIVTKWCSKCLFAAKLQQSCSTSYVFRPGLHGLTTVARVGLLQVSINLSKLREQGIQYLIKSQQQD